MNVVESSSSSSPILSSSNMFRRHLQLIGTSTSGIFGRSPENDRPPPPPLTTTTTKFQPNTLQQQQERRELPLLPPLASASNNHTFHQRNNTLPTNVPEDDDDDDDGTRPIERLPLASPPSNGDAVIHPPPPPPPQLATSLGQSHTVVPQRQQQQQQQQSHEIQSYQEQLYYLHQDLQLAYQREQQLLADLHNLTSMTQEARQRETLHMHQLDVLTERIIHIETEAARHENQLLEYQNNCTNLLSEMERQKGYAQEWQEKCQSLLESHKVDEVAIQELKIKVKDATREVEALATMIEEHRLSETDTTIKKKRRNKKKKAFNLFAWLFGWTTDHENDDDQDQDEHTDRQDLYDTARSTLLTALQNERDNVNELESTIATLQQNNSAVEATIQSRDATIAELTNRMSSYDDEKLVLNAALRQLQMERNEDAPKRKALQDELKQAQSEIVRLNQEIDVIMQRHNTTVANLQRQVAGKVEEYQAVQYNLTVMGTYVNKLEERLTDFTVARRDIEERELLCRDIETKTAEMKTERDALQTQVRAMEQEHDELKTLLSELVQERSKLLERVNASTTKTKLLDQDVQRLRQSYAKLDNEVRSVRAECQELQGQKGEMELRLQETISRNVQLEQECEQLTRDKQQLQLSVNNASVIKDQNEQQSLKEAAMMQTTFQQRIAHLEKELATSRREHEVYKKEAQAVLLTKEQEMERIRAEEKVEHRNVTVADEIRPQPNETNVVVAMEDNGSTVVLNQPMTEESLRISSSIPRRRHFGEVVVPLPKPASVSIVKPTVQQQLLQQQKQQALVPKSNHTTTSSPRNVPLRQVRKLLARATGIHGLIQKSTTRRP